MQSHRHHRTGPVLLSLSPVMSLPDPAPDSEASLSTPSSSSPPPPPVGWSRLAQTAPLRHGLAEHGVTVGSWVGLSAVGAAVDGGLVVGAAVVGVGVGCGVGANVGENVGGAQLPEDRTIPGGPASGCRAVFMQTPAPAIGTHIQPQAGSAVTQLVQVWVLVRLAPAPHIASASKSRASAWHCSADVMQADPTADVAVMQARAQNPDAEDDSPTGLNLR